MPVPHKTIALPILVLCLATQVFPQIARGADVGWLSELENSKRKFYDKAGEEKDLLDILKGYCINSIRLRVWVNPTTGWSNKQDVVAMAKRVHAKHYRLMIDFHYSDSWADPAQQNVPLAWRSYSVNQLEQAIAEHTSDVLNALKHEGISPEWVQIGNETNDGMLWPQGKASTNMANYAKFVQSGSLAAKAVFPETKTIVHLSNGFDNALFRWNIGGLVQNNASFDVIAISLYPEVDNWDSLATMALHNLTDMESRYHKEVMMSEIGLGVGYPIESKAFIETMIRHIESIPNHHGLGVFWWEPEAYDWRGYTRVAWLNDGRPSTAMEGFQTGCPTQPPPPPPEEPPPSHLNQRKGKEPYIPRHSNFDLLGRKIKTFSAP